MPPRRRSPLFSAVVLAGASLTHMVGACGGDSEAPPTDDASTPTGSEDGATRSDATSPPVDASGGGDGAAIKDAETCPDGSDRPTPPCHYIR